MSDDERDRNFGPTVRAQVERAITERLLVGRVDAWDARQVAKPASTDPRWNAAAGGLPEQDARNAGLRSDTCAGGEPGIAGTITPPTIESSFLWVKRAELERILLDLDVARERLAKLLERS